MNQHLALLVFTLVSLSSTFSAACRMVSLEKSPQKYIQKMIRGTADVYIAEAASYSKTDEAFTFKVIETVRGEKKESLTIGGVDLDAAGTDKDFIEKNSTDFNGHRNSVFWDNIFTGRTTFGTDCRLNPAFQVGKRYLIFAKEPYQAKSFELMKSKGDKWYQFVFETYYPPKKPKKIEVKPADPAATTAPAAAPAATPAPTPPAADTPQPAPENR